LASGSSTANLPVLYIVRTSRERKRAGGAPHD
jgi:hypothetical protein